MLQPLGVDSLPAEHRRKARRRIRAAHALAHPGAMEGGARLVIEAINSGTSVLASRIEGKVGLLGDDFEGCFPVGDAAALARLPERSQDEPAMLVGLRDRCARRAALFRPDRERAAGLALVDELLETTR